MKKDSVIYATSRRVALGFAASGGLICAACLSALPSSTCGAIASVYLQGIQAFGAVGFCGVAILGAIETPSREDQREHRIDTFFSVLLLVVGGISLLLGFFLSVSSLPDAVHICWPSNP